MRFSLTVLSLFLLFTGCKSTDNSPALPVDASIHQGTLPNGMKYIIKENKTPPDKVEMYLHVGSGSLDEEDNQQGLAHFLEHMAFNGSKNFPAGTLVKYFESLGLTFGRHQNAFTGFDQTTYILSMPNTKNETIDKGLLCLSDFAFRLDLLVAEIDKERGVIEEEQRARTSVRQRIMEKMLPVLLPKSHVANRLPIGKMEVIQKAERQRFVDFYKKWYHPENSTVIIVGDVKKDDIEKMITQHFKDWKKKDSAPEHLDPKIKTYEKTRSFVITDKELTEASVSLTSIKEMKDMKTVADYKRDLTENLADWMFNKRLGNMVKSQEAEFQSASAGQSSFLNVCTYISASADGKAEKWQPILTQLTMELKRARQFGFLQQELDDAMKTYLSSAERAVDTEATRKNAQIVRELNNLVSLNQLPMSAKQELDLMTEILKTMSLADVNASFNSAYAPEKRLIMLELPEKDGLKVPTEAEVLKAVEAAEKIAVKAPYVKERPKQLLAKDPDGGKISNKKFHEKTKVTSVFLENGCVCHHKHSALNKDSVTVRLRFAGGKIEETAQNKGITGMALLPLQQPSTDKLSSVDIESLMTGKNVSVHGASDDDSIILNITGSKADLEEGLRLAYLLIHSAKIEEAAFNLVKEQSMQQLATKDSSVDRQLVDSLRKISTNNDPRFQMATKESINRLSIKDSQAWLHRILKSAPVEASIVGDIDADTAVKLMTKYLGSLPERGTASHLDSLRKIDNSQSTSKKITVDTKTPKSLVLIAFRGPDYKDKAESRMIRLAAQILSSRLHKEIREERQLTYSASCFARSTPGFTGRGMIMSYFTAQKDKAEKAAEICKKVLYDFAANGPTQQELDTVRKQFTTNLTTEMEQPSFWSVWLADMNTRGKDLDTLTKILELYMSYDAKAIQKTVQKYFVKEKNISIVVVPK